MEDVSQDVKDRILVEELQKTRLDIDNLKMVYRTILDDVLSLKEKYVSLDRDVEYMKDKIRSSSL